MKKFNITKMPEDIPPTYISKETFISVSLLVTLAGGVIWLTTMYNDIGYLKLTITELKTNVQQQIADIRTDIKEIKKLITENK